MRSLVLMTAAAMVLFGCSSTFAQVGSTSTRNAPAMRTTSPGMPTTSPAAVPGTIPTVGANPGTALGTINTGTLGQISGSTIGTITACPTTGTAAAPSTIFNASSADPIYGTLPPQPLPGATVPPASSFGTSIMNGTCDPTAIGRATIEALGSSLAVSIPGLATITGSTYSDATIPSAATEAGGAGLSPLIVVPTPVTPSASPSLATTTGSMYSGATIPSTATEAGEAGLSPLIIVPTPVNPSASP